LALLVTRFAVPRPIAVSDGVIVMQYLGDLEGAAPQLKDVSLSPGQAASAFRWLMYDVELMLGANVVHGDPSPYNVLWWKDRATIIETGKESFRFRRTLAAKRKTPASVVRP